MFGLLRRLLGGGSGKDAVVLNLALALAQDWGADFRKPTTERMRERYPWLSERQLEGIDTEVQAAMRSGHDLVVELSRQQSDPVSLARFRRAFRRRFPWVNRDNLERLYRNGCYFAWK